MCGRFTHMFTWRELHRLLSLSIWPEFELSPRFNVAPTQAAPVVRRLQDGRREGVMMHWGLIPSWADSPEMGGKMINARAETVATRPAYRAAFAHRRCLVPISGFYEWKKPELAKSPKQPYWIGRSDRAPFVLAGLWEHWGRGEDVVDSFTIITTAANTLLADIHDRMPVILEAADYEAWLDPGTDAQAAAALLRPADHTGFEKYTVSSRVNSPRNDDRRLLEPVEAAPEGLFG